MKFWTISEQLHCEANGGFFNSFPAVNTRTERILHCRIVRIYTKHVCIFSIFSKKTFQMKRFVLLLTTVLTFLLITSVVTAQSNPFTGSWLGTITTSGLQLRIAFHISEQEGIIITKMDSPDQNSFGNAAHKTTVSGNHIIIDLPLMGAKYDGTLENDSIKGTFYQGGNEIPLKMGKFEGQLSAPKRSQVPQAPFPYKEKEVTIKTTDPKVKLSGTLTTPTGKEPFPAVILISGSGPQDRNEELMGHKPFHVLADHLSRNGIAVLRYDDRGVGKSTGEFNKATSIDFATDAEAAWKFLHKQKGIDKTKVGIIGHSEGGLIAPIVASANKHVGFIILMAGPSVPGGIIIPDQQELIMRASGTDEEEIRQQTALTQLIINYIFQHAASTSLQQDLTTQIEGWIKELNFPVPKSSSPKNFARQTAYTYTSDWMKTFIITSPADFMKDVTCPVLALFGENDLQVSVRANMEPMQQLLHSHKGSSVHTFPKLNHLFQTSETGAPSEYLLIEETLSPAFMEYVSNWILNLK